MTKAEKNYKRDYGHKDSEELALNYTRDGMKEELDGVLNSLADGQSTFFKVNVFPLQGADLTDTQAHIIEDTKTYC